MAGEYTTTTHPRRRTFWAYTYTSYNQSSVTVIQPRILDNNYDRCVAAGGAGNDNPCKRGWGSMHPGGLQVCDGSVKFLSYNINFPLFEALSTVRGGEPTEDF